MRSLRARRECEKECGHLTMGNHGSFTEPWNCAFVYLCSLSLTNHRRSLGQLFKIWNGHTIGKTQQYSGCQPFTGVYNLASSLLTGQQMLRVSEAFLLHLDPVPFFCVLVGTCRTTHEHKGCRFRERMLQLQNVCISWTEFSPLASPLPARTSTMPFLCQSD